MSNFLKQPKEEEAWKFFAGKAINGYIITPSMNEKRSEKIEAAIECADKLTKAFMIRYGDKD